MPIHTADIALVFDEIADLLEIQGANVFRVRAYRNAARTLRDLGREMSAMVETYENLAALPGIGRDLAGKSRRSSSMGPKPSWRSTGRESPGG